ncbi:MAG: HNH endonuclease signature motif containing protein [Clostridium celatum]|nr:HNH endonuclease signature motif containing protein [Clostridium celatum]MDU4980862.1 HNH endonuclease signature motif containing protein [Clostridium celatum]
MLKIHRECQICGLKNEKLLVASHLKPYKDCSDEESADIYNGLLLCSGHDKPFDIGLITFDEEGKILISKELSDNDIKRLNIDENTRINLLEDNIKYIKWHKNEVFVDNKKHQRNK